MTRRQLVLALALDELHENWPNKPMRLDELKEMRDHLADLIRGYKVVVYGLCEDDFMALVADCS